MNNRTMFLVHGSGRKPSATALEGLWREAITSGLERDFPKLVARWHEVDVRFVYYGNWNQSLFGEGYDEVLDVADRRRSLEQLKSIDKAKGFRRVYYEQVPGKSPVREFLADIGLPVAATLGLGRKVLGRIVPELDRYWSGDDALTNALTSQLTEPLSAALGDGRNVMVVGHCVGSVMAFDTLWRLSQLSTDNAREKVASFVTLGSPLADETVKRARAGAKAAGVEGYPRNILAWHNFAAEDDYVCHDGTVNNDYADMLKHRLIGAIEDHPIYNLAIRYSRSNPHSSLGYLIHPRFVRVVADWLQAEPPALPL